MIAEDLGVITPPVERLRLELGFPGMAVLIFGFRGGRGNPHRPENHSELLVVYTGTHDTHTAVGWWNTLTAAGADGDRARSGGAALVAGRARTRVPRGALDPPAQDILGLGDDARMNRPGTTVDNWVWRLEEGQLTAGLAARLRAATERAGR